MICIFCDKENTAVSIEHIVSEAFGNKYYVAERSRVCDECNQRFSKFEGTALTSSIFIMERARHGIPTKRGKTAKGKVGEFSIEGDESFEKNLITIKGLTESNFEEYDPKTNKGKITIKNFDKSEVATSKLLLKMALSSIFTSKRKIYDNYNFTELKDFLLARNNNDWPFVVTDFEISPFESIPRQKTKYTLSILRCSLRYCELNSETLLFMFKYGAIPMVINLLNRNLDWIPDYIKNDKIVTLYPEHYRMTSSPKNGPL